MSSSRSVIGTPMEVDVTPTVTITDGSASQMVPVPTAPPTAVTMEALAEAIRSIQGTMVSTKDLSNYLRSLGSQATPNQQPSRWWEVDGWEVKSLPDSTQESEGEVGNLPPEFAALFGSSKLLEMERSGELGRYVQAWGLACRAFAGLDQATNQLEGQKVVDVSTFLRAACNYV